MLRRKSDQPLYDQIVQQIAGQIERGVYRVGDAIPSVREGKRIFRVSAGTLLEAYRRLEDRGLIRARSQSGYYVRERRAAAIAPTRSPATSATPRQVSGHIAVEMLRRMCSPDMVQLGAAVPDPELLPVRALNVRLARALRVHSPGVHAYGPMVGLPKLRRRLALMMADSGCTVGPDEVIVTHGCTEAIYLCLKAVTQPNDIVAIESPAYYGLLLTLKSLNLRALPITCSVETGLCVDALIEASQRHRIAAVVVTPSFSNPTGSCMPDDERQRLAEWAQTTGTPVIEDDIYGELHRGDRRPMPIKAGDTDGYVLYCSSISKTLSPGLRVGWCAPGRFLERVEQLKISTNLSCPVTSQHALADFLEHGGLQKHLRRLRRHYRDQVDRFRERFASTLRVPFRINEPAGGHLLWIELPAGVDTVDLFHRAVRRGVTFAPGPIFSPTTGFTNYMRINCAVAWSDRVAKAIRTLSDLITDAAAVSQDKPA